MIDQIVVFATAWGPRKGGINAFNADLCVALRQVVNDTAAVVCVLVGASSSEADLQSWKAEAAAQDIRLERLSTPSDKAPPSDSLVEALKRLDTAGSLYIGHDTFTGAWAVEAGGRLGRPCAVINHMAPPRYKALEGARGDDIWPDEKKQAALFEAADVVGAVGPRLFDYACSLIPESRQAKVVQLIPGLAAIEPRSMSKMAFGGIAIGRINEKDDVLKQGRLAARAFALAARRLNASGDLAGYDVGFRAIGLSQDVADYQTESDNLTALLQQEAGCAISFLGHRFNEQRDELFDAISRQDVFYMLSLHDGFGLAGLEAIAAGVPLVLAKKCGLHDFLKELGLERLVIPVNLLGLGTDASQEDLHQVADRTVELFRNRVDARARARELRTTLRQRGDLTWENCARALLKACQLERLLQDPASTTSVAVPPRKAWPWRGMADHEEASARRVLAWLLSREGRHLLIQGAPDEHKRGVLGRILDLVRWDLDALYRLRVESIPAGPATGVLQRVVDVLAARGGAGAAAGACVLLVLDPPLDADAAFWAALSQCTESTRSLALLTGWEGSGLPPLEALTPLPWTPSPRPRAPVVLGFGGDSDPVEDDARALLAATTFGLRSDELFEFLADGNSEDERYALITRLHGGEVDGIAASEERWVARAPSPYLYGEDPVATAAGLAAALQPDLQAAIEAVRNGHRAALDRLLPSALEALVQQARAGDADRAFELLHTGLLDAVLEPHARFDRAWRLMGAFFEDGRLDRCRLSDAWLVSQATEQAAQALMHLGRVDEAMPWLEHALRTQPRPAAALVMRTALCSFLRGRYAQAESLLQAAADPSATAEPPLGAVHRLRAALYLRLLRLEEAEAELDRARDWYASAGDVRALAGIDACRAELAVARGAPDEALGCVMQGLLTLRSPDTGHESRRDARVRARLALAHGRALLTAGSGQEARSVVADALAHAVRSGALDLTLEANALSALAEEQVGAARLAGLERLALQAGQYGLRHHQAALVLASAGLEMRCGNAQAARAQALRAQALAGLDGGRYEDAWLKREALRLVAEASGTSPA